jgi:hypothetical protein
MSKYSSPPYVEFLLAGMKSQFIRTLIVSARLRPVEHTVPFRMRTAMDIGFALRFFTMFRMGIIKKKRAIPLLWKRETETDLL